MFGFSKKKVDIEKGKRIFFEYKGDSFGIDMDVGSDYWKCNIPKSLEKQWLEEINKKKE